MALVVRCETHGVPKRGRKSAYVFVAEPLGGSADPGITCGKHGCRNPGLVFMDVIDAAKYNKGVRTFRGEQPLARPRQIRDPRSLGAS
jgi:hypothetical protein